MKPTINPEWHQATHRSIHEYRRFERFNPAVHQESQRDALHRDFVEVSRVIFDGEKWSANPKWADAEYVETLIFSPHRIAVT